MPAKKPKIHKIGIRCTPVSTAYPRHEIDDMRYVNCLRCIRYTEKTEDYKKYLEMKRLAAEKRRKDAEEREILSQIDVEHLRRRLGLEMTEGEMHLLIVGATYGGAWVIAVVFGIAYLVLTVGQKDE